jgi:hypothetical protein
VQSSVSPQLPLMLILGVCAMISVEPPVIFQDLGSALSLPREGREMARRVVEGGEGSGFVVS